MAYSLFEMYKMKEHIKQMAEKKIESTQLLSEMCQSWPYLNWCEHRCEPVHLSLLGVKVRLREEETGSTLLCHLEALGSCSHPASLLSHNRALLHSSVFV